MNKHVYFFIGTTAELIKLAPIIKEAQKRKIEYKIISSGQGELLKGEFSGYLRNFNIDIAFKKKSKKSSVLLFAIWALRTLIDSFVYLRKEFKGLNKKNSYFIVHGDTISSLIGAIIARAYGLKLVHIESGLRSFNFLEPFPEELSRYIISSLADVHFCPNEWSLTNLKNSSGVKINTLHNTLVETFYWAVNWKGKLKKLYKPRGKYFVLVMHRQEHVIFGKKRSTKIIKFVIDNSKKDLSCVLMTYATSLSFLRNYGLNLRHMSRKVFLTPRQRYEDFMKLLSSAEYICTDGGSNQEELYYMGKPCLLLRKFTERKEGLGQNVVLSKLNNRIIKKFLINYKKYKRDEVYFHKRPSEIIVNYLVANDSS